MTVSKKMALHPARYPNHAIFLLVTMIILTITALVAIRDNVSIPAPPHTFLENPPTSETIEGVEILSIKNAETPRISVDYPKTPNDSVNESLKVAAEDLVDSFKRSTTSPETAELYQSFRATRYNNETLSFLFTSLENSADHPTALEEVYTCTYHLPDAKQYTLGDLFSVGEEEYLKILSEKLANILKEDDSLADEEATRLLLSAPTPESFSRFTLSDTGITFHFSPREIWLIDGAPTSSFISFEDLKPILAEPFRPADPVPDTASTPPEPPAPPPAYSRPAPIAESSGPKYIALTFDDGPHGSLTPALLNHLRDNGVKATFFVLGSRVPLYPDLLRRAHSEGHQIASHTTNHKDLTALSLDSLRYEINTTADLIEQIIGVRPTAMRPPYGAINNNVRTYANAAIIMWSVDPADWRYQNANMVANHVASRVRDGSIVLLHDLYPTTIEAVTQIIPNLRSRNYHFLTINELITLRAGTSIPGQTYSALYP